MTDQVDVLIVGAGHAGGTLATVLNQKKYDGRICMIGDEAALPYERPPLSKAYFTGEQAAERLYLRKADYWAEREIDILTSTSVTALDAARRTATLSDGRTLGYQWCVLATGGRVRPLPVPGADLAGVHYLRSLGDVDVIRADLAPGARMVVIGGGYIGLEVAASARKLGHPVTVVEAMERVLARVTSPQISDFFQRYHRSQGVDIRLGLGVVELTGADGRVSGVALSDGSAVAADIVIVGIGIIPNDELARSAGLAVANGIVVDASCRTSDPHILAIGDVAQHPNPFAQGADVRLESVQNAVDQAKIAAGVITGAPEPYGDLPWFWSDQYDVKLQTAGLARNYDQTVLRGDDAAPGFSLIYLRDGQVIAIDAVNAMKDFMAGKKLVQMAARIAPETLADVDIPLKELAQAATSA